MENWKQTKKENKEKNTPEKGKIISLPMLDTNPEDAGVLFFSFITKRECLSKWHCTHWVLNQYYSSKDYV